MDLTAFSLPEWLPASAPAWAVIAVLLPAALYLALFLLMPFQVFGLRGRIRELELRIDALHEELRGMTLRLPERGMDPYDDPPPRAAPPIPPAPRGGFGDPVADKMLDYMRDKARTDMQRAEAPRPRTEPRVFPPRAPAPPMDDLPPPPHFGEAEPPPADAPPPPPRGRFGRRFAPPPPPDDEPPPPRPNWQR